MAANYRIDKVQKQSDPNAQYQIPCGMNSIIFLGDKPPHRTFLQGCKKKDNEVFLMSKWSDKECTFKIIAIHL